MASTIKTLSIVNYKTFKGHDGMRGINAEIKYKGKKIASVYDDARGAEYQYSVLGYGTPKYTENKALFNQLLKEVKTLDKVKTLDFELDPCLDFLIDDMCNEKDMAKDAKKGLLIKTNWGYEILQWNVQIPTLIKKYRNGLEVVQKEYDKQKSTKTILNTKYLESIGITI